MTEQELANKRLDDDKYQALLVRWSRLHDDVLVMRREIERLQGIIKQAEWSDGSREQDSCPWCGESLPFMKPEGGVHMPTCPAFGGETGKSDV